MKNTRKSKETITSQLLAGLTIPQTPAPKNDTAKKGEASLGRTNKTQPDLSHDSGGGYNSDLSSVQS